MTTDSRARLVSTPGHVRGLGHLVLYVADLDRSVEFYRDLLGWPLTAKPQTIRAAIFRAGDTHHDLILIQASPDAEPMPPSPRLGLYHFGVKVGESDDDLRALHHQLTSRPDLATVVGAVNGGFIHSLFVEDPDGNEVELFIDVPGWNWDEPGLFERAGRRPLRL